MVAFMAVVTLVVGWWDRTHPGPAPSQATISTEVPSRQPLAVFHVYIGCGQPPQEVLRDDVHTDMPVTVFDHRDVNLTVVDNALHRVPVVVRLRPDDSIAVVSGPAVYVNSYLSVAAGQVPVCS